MELDVKGQDVRILDVVAIGPLMIWGGWKLRDDPLGILLMLAGVGTILYNAHNYQKIKEAEAEEPKKLPAETVKQV